jgi:hypothetical protein
MEVARAEGEKAVEQVMVRTAVARAAVVRAAAAWVPYMGEMGAARVVARAAARAAVAKARNARDKSIASLRHPLWHLNMDWYFEWGRANWLLDVVCNSRLRLGEGAIASVPDSR